ncbi:retinol dehydrogenase 12-like isoform X2 [Gordionus sp. m RMFG-2023]|uniref:retinol dehydrogenase 12-like isoform X2 n=1 Tax=Gordionus sp. m RMFG-2023 TaxID=3053472 RepID=UPI0031FDE863
MLPLIDFADLPWKFIISVGIFFAIRTYFRGTRYNSKENLDGKIIVITGADSGIGFEVTKDLLSRGAVIIMACHNIKNGEMAIEKLKEAKCSVQNLIIKQIELASFHSVRAFANDINKEYEKIDVLINNAGIMMHPNKFTEDDFEIHFAVNYLAHFLLSLLLLKPLIKSNNGRIINMTSVSHRIARLNLNCIEKKKDSIIKTDDQSNSVILEPRDYFAMSKLAIMLSTRILAKKLEANDGAQTVIYCAIEKTIKDITGKYFRECDIAEPGLNVKDDDSSNNLWLRSLEMCKITNIPIL